MLKRYVKTLKTLGNLELDIEKHCLIRTISEEFEYPYRTKKEIKELKSKLIIVNAIMYLRRRMEGYAE